VTLSSLDPRRDARKILAVLGGAVLLNALVWFFLVRPRQHSATAMESEKQSFVRDYQAAQDREKGLRGEWERIVSAEEGLRKFYTEQLGTKRERLVSIEKAIQQVAMEFQIDPREVRFDSEDVVEGRVERFAVRTPLRGDYQSLRRFIARLEGAPRFWVIDRVSLSGTKEGGATLQLNVDVATYFDAPWLANGKGARRTGAAPAVKR